MRTTLLPALVENLAYNISRGSADVSLFEASKVFIDEGGELPREPMRLAAISHHGSGPALYQETAEPFFRMKGTLEALLAAIRVSGVTYAPTEEPFLHPGKGADILVSGRPGGYIGVLSPDVVGGSGIKTKHEVAVFELDLDMILSAIPEYLQYRPVPRFPSIERDVALVLDKEVRCAEALDAICSHKSGFMEEVSVFDVYEGKGVPEGKKSLAFNIRYRAADRTMTDEEVDTIHNALVKDVLEKTGGSLRS